MADVSFQAHWKKSMKAALGEEAKAARIAATKGMKLGVDRLKTLVRGQVRGAGLGDRVANAVRGVAYPKGGTSVNPAGTVYSNAPHIMNAFEQGVTIRPVNNGNTYLAIPTKDCPRAARGRRMTPAQAEQRFGRPTILFAGRNKGVIMFDLIRSKNNKGWRKASKGRRAQGRDPQRIVMFVLVRQVRLPKRLNVSAALAQAGRELPGYVAASWPGGVS